MLDSWIECGFRCQRCVCLLVRWDGALGHKGVMLWLAGMFLLGMSGAVMLMQGKSFLFIFFRFDLISFEEKFIIHSET